MKQIIIGLFQTLFGLLAPLYMIPLVFLIRWDKDVSGSGSLDDPSMIVRGDLPNAFKWAQTMDCRFPAGMYELAMVKALGNGSYWRRLWTAYLWCGLRNRAQGLAYKLGKATNDWIPDPYDIRRTEWVKSGSVMRYSRDDVWQTWRKIGPVWIVYGWQVYQLRDGSFWAVNHFSAKSA